MASKVYIALSWTYGDPCPRFMEHHLSVVMTHSPVVILEGARAVGKTSLLRQLHQQGLLAELQYLNHEEIREAAQRYPLT